MALNSKSDLKIKKSSTAINLTEGPIVKNILLFAIPLFMGQLLQQFYNMADAWVIGNFADNDAFAAVSSAGSMTFLIVGLFNGIAIGGGVIISKYYGAKDKENVVKAIHTNFLFGILASIASTIVGLVLMPHILVWMKTPESVMPNSLSYFTIYFAGVSTVIMYNICMSIMRSLGDSIHPLYYLVISSVINVALDLLFVAVFRWGVAGAAIATVIAQGLSVILCLIRMCRLDDYTRLNFKKIHFYKDIMAEVITQGLPTGIQNAVISIGNLTVQTNINSFGAYAMAGVGAYSKIEGFVFNHGLGHGIGINVHEAPPNLSVNEIAKTSIKNNMCFTIEPGLYNADFFGIRLENSCYLENGKITSFTNMCYEAKLIDYELLSEQEKVWLNDFEVL